MWCNAGLQAPICSTICKWTLFVYGLVGFKLQHIKIVFKPAMHHITKYRRKISEGPEMGKTQQAWTLMQSLLMLNERVILHSWDTNPMVAA